MAMTVQTEVLAIIHNQMYENLKKVMLKTVT